MAAQDQPAGKDAIKGGYFFGSSLTPSGVFPNLPTYNSGFVPPQTESQKKFMLTLEQVKEELQRSASAENNTSEDVLSTDSINTYLTTFVQLLIDYQDLRNYVFFGSAYTELVYHIDTLIKTYPYQSYFAIDYQISNSTIVLQNLSGGKTRIGFTSSDILQPATFVYDTSGQTIWTNFDIVDKNDSRFPILSINETTYISNVTYLLNTITVTTTENHNLLTGETVTISNVVGITQANTTAVVTVTGLNTFTFVSVPTPTGVYLEGGSLVAANIHLIVDGIVSVNNLIEYEPSLTELFKGLVVSPKIADLTNFDVQLPGEQKALLSSNNPTPWPRSPITNNIIVEGIEFDNWVETSTNMVPPIAGDDLGILNVDGEALNLRGALALDEETTNQLLRKAIPYQLVDELNDADDKLFTRFVLIAGRFFDTIKTYIDFLKYVHSLNYTQFNQLSPEFYKLYAEHYGFDLFDDDNVDIAKAIIRTEPGLRYDNLNNLVFDNSADSKTIQELQYEKQKRLLLNLLHLYKTKGTQKSIKFLTSLLGAPEGLVLIDEFFFNTLTGLREVDNTKIHVPNTSFEIDPTYLVNPNNIYDAANLPFVYRLKLENETSVNLREAKIATDPQGAIANQILEYGKTVFPYMLFKNGCFANLQNETDKHLLLPLSVPEKYMGITVEYMIPKGGFTKGVSDINEVSMHLASLYEVGAITYDNPTTPTTISPMTAGNNFGLLSPALFMDSLSSVGIQDNKQLVPASEFRFSLNGYSYGAGISIDIVLDSNTIYSGTTEATLEETIQKICFEFNDIDLYPYFGFVFHRIGATYDVTTNELVFKIEVGDQTYDTFLSELYFDGNLFASQNVSDSPSIVQLASSSRMNYFIARIEGQDLVIRSQARSELSVTLSNKRVAIYKNVFEADGLNHQLRLIYRPEGVEVYVDYKFQGVARWLNPTTTSGPLITFEPYDAPKDKFDLFAPLPMVSNLYAYPDKLNTLNPGNDKPKWFDLVVGLPINLEIYVGRVAIFDSLGIDTPDVLDSGLTTSGIEVEKFSFDLKNQSKDTNNVKFANKISIPCQYRAPNPDATDTNTFIETYLTSLAQDNLISAISLTSKHYKDGVVQYLEDVQGFFKLPNNQVVTLDSLFKYNAWSPTIHKDYDYESFYNEAYKNYELFSNQVLTYLALIPFLELLENKFQTLIKQFIPIVINLTEFGRLIRNNPFNQPKVRYANIHFECDGSQLASNAITSFDLTYGTYDVGVNYVELLFGPLPSITADWGSTNNYTLSLIAGVLNTYSPMIVAEVQYSTLKIEVDPNLWFTTYGTDINNETITINTYGNVTIDNVKTIGHGVMGLTGACDKFKITRTFPPFVFQPAYTYIYQAAENGLPTYIYQASETLPPLYID